MGRKKRKVAVVDAKVEPNFKSQLGESQNQQQQQQQQQLDNKQQEQEQQNYSKNQQGKQQPQQQQNSTLKSDRNYNANDGTEVKKVSSGYAITSHSADIIDADIYVSDGSESDEDLMADLNQTSKKFATDGEENESSANEDDGQKKYRSGAGRAIDMVLSGSRMGLMRRGIHHPSSMLLVQPNRQWARQNSRDLNGTGEEGAVSGNNDGEDPHDDTEDPATAEERRKREKEEELAKLDPAERAARLLAEKQRKLEEAKILARKLESEENAGRDVCLFSKRTSFDIRFDQIDDKPWTRGGDMTDFFNYGFSEEDWLEYGEQQLMIRQELVDANRQSRAPDPTIVPVIPKKPKKQNPRVAVTISKTNTSNEGAKDNANAGCVGIDTKDNDDGNGDDENAPIVGPVLKKEAVIKDEVMQVEIANSTNVTKEFTEDVVDDIEIVGGAWGAKPGSVLAKLIEEQEKQQQIQSKSHQQKESHETDTLVTSHNSGSDSGKTNNSNINTNVEDRHFQNNQHQQQQGWNHLNSQGERNRNQNNCGNSDWNNVGNQEHYNNNNRNLGAGQPNNWNNRNQERSPVPHYQHPHQKWDAGGRGGGRSGFRNYGGKGGGRGEIRDYDGGRGGGRGGDFQHRKRPREDHGGDRYRR